MEDIESWNLLSIMPSLSLDSLDKIFYENVPNFSYLTDKLNLIMRSDDFHLLLDTIIKIITKTYFNENKKINNIDDFLPLVLPKIKENKKKIFEKVKESTYDNISNNDYAKQIPNFDKLFINIVDEIFGKVIFSLEEQSNLKKKNQKVNNQAVRRILAKK